MIPLQIRFQDETPKAVAASVGFSIETGLEFALIHECESGVKLYAPGEDFACHSASCRPPTSGGTGGSVAGPKGSVGAEGGAEINVSRGGKTKGEIGTRSQHISGMTDKAKAQMVESFQQIPGMEHIKTAEEALSIVKDRLKATAELAIANGYTPHMAQSASRWYDVANSYAGEMTKEFGFNHPETAAGVLATLSPSAAWESNVYNARQVMQMTSQNPHMTETDASAIQSRSVRILSDKRDILKKAKSDLSEIDANIAEMSSSAAHARILASIEGKRFNDLDDKTAVMLMHGITQRDGAKGITLIPSPDGSYKVQEYSGKATIQSNSNMVKALKMARADLAGASKQQMAEEINLGVSQESKVRAFYMNIAHPNDRTQDAITADTHFYSAAVGIPLNAQTAKPHFTSTSEIGFARGYPVYRQALQDLMPYLSERLGVDANLPSRSAQSVLWEMERFLVPQTAKGRFIANKEKMDTMADIYRNGTADEAKRYYFEQSGGKVQDRVEGAESEVRV